MSSFEERIKEIEALRTTLVEGQFFLGYENKLLIIKLLEKHMESLQSMYRGHVQGLLQNAVQTYLYPPAVREKNLAPYITGEDLRYIRAVWAALDTVPRPDYLPSED